MLTGFDILSERYRQENTQESDAGAAGSGTVPEPLPDKLREVDLTLRPDRERAVDALELAAYLEADGLSDESLRERYGAGGLFAAAELLYAQRGTGRALERRHDEPAPRFPWHLAQRGLLYLMPGVGGLLLGGAVGAGATLAFVFAAAFGWGYSMLITSLRYAEPFGVPGRALRLALALGGACGLVGGMLAAGLANPAQWSQQWSQGLLLGGVVSLATASSGVLLSLDQRGQVAAAFAPPLLLAAGVDLLPHLFPHSPQVILAQQLLLALALLTFVGLPLLLALRATRTPGVLPARWSSFRPGLLLAAYGWALAATFVGLNQQLGGWALLPVVLSAGLLEAGVWNAQQYLQYFARRQGEFSQLVRRGIWQVIGTALVYGAVLLGGLLLAGPGEWLAVRLGVPGLAMPGESTPGFNAAPLRSVLFTVPAFGTALLLSTWLANQRRSGLLLVLWAVLSLLLVLRVLSPPQLVVAALFVLLPLTTVTLRDLRSYR